jgi:signal transduction histidine kinase
MSVGLPGKVPGSGLPHTGAPDRAALGGEGLAMLAQAVMALRTTGDLGTACAIAGACAVRALDATEYRLLRVDSRSGALRLLEESGVETPYLAERGGPVEAVLRTEVPLFDDGSGGERALRETLLWLDPPAALITLPLHSGSTLFGVLIVAFAASREVGADERLFLQTLGDGLALALERAELRDLLDSERRRMAELERRVLFDEEASSSLMSVVAHEIRTPLTAIKAYAESLLETLHNPHTPRERFLGIINDECDRLTRLVSDILDLSRLEAGQRPLRLTRIDAHALARDVAESLEPLSHARQIAIEISPGPTLIVEADADLLQFSPVGGRVRVEGTVQGEEWLGTVTDEGPGIPAEDLGRVFERFFRSRLPGEQQVEGSGLGLAIARGIAELHGGRIWAESPEGGGSRFCFALPLRQMATPQARRIARHVALRADLRALFDDARGPRSGRSLHRRLARAREPEPRGAPHHRALRRGRIGGRLGPSGAGQQHRDRPPLPAPQPPAVQHQVAAQRAAARRGRGAGRAQRQQQGVARGVRRERPVGARGARRARRQRRRARLRLPRQRAGGRGGARGGA